MTHGMRVKTFALAFVALFTVVASAQALTLDEQRQYDKWNAYFATEGSSSQVQKTCGMTLPVKLDQAFTTPFMTENKNAASFCNEALNAIAHTCSDDAGKKAVTAKIKSLSCIYSSKTDEASLKLDPASGELQFTYGTDASNLDEKVQKFLGSNL